MWRIARLALLVVGAGLLTSCATVTTLQAQITSYGQWPAGRAPGSYAFERLPSQQAQPEAQQRVEDAAHGALAAAGFSLVQPGAQPDVLVEVGARVTRFEPGPWADPWWYGGFGFWRWHRPWVGPYAYPYAYGSRPVTDREVGLLLRDRASGAPLYEARASSDAYSNSTATLSAMFRAAMADFPKSSSVPHSVTVPLPP
ncbi:MAG: hypothetical protein LKCHEGNO_03027 [Burkholderiaceae bacterium]|nr:hypothetical protein [Burkholderiaceae bacterium]